MLSLIAAAAAPALAATYPVGGLSYAGAAAGSHYAFIEPPSYDDCRRVRLFPCRRGVPLPILRVLVGPPRLPDSHTGDVASTKCIGKYLGAVCGTVSVPLDRKHPQSGTIAIFFELFTHVRGGPARSAILVNDTGGGAGTTGALGTYFALALFGSNLFRDDLLLIDDRGRGFSGTIQCTQLERGNGPFADAEADCAAQLGQAASRYGSGDIAKDTDAVRAALGYEKVDYFGASDGGADVTAYATRFGSRIRALVLDAPVGTPALNPLVFDRYNTNAEPRAVRLACAYSPTCRRDNPDPVTELHQLVRSIQTNPVEGNAYDANGNLIHVRIDETTLLNFVLHQDC